MRKHEMSYHEKNDFIKFTSDFCSHSREMMNNDTEKNKEKNISFRKKCSSDQSEQKKSENSTIKKKTRIVIKILFRKDREMNSLSRKDYKSNQSNQDVDDSSFKETSKNSKSKIDVFTMNIAMIEISTFNMMSKRKNVHLFSVILKNVEKHLEKTSKSNIIFKNVLSFEYHDFLNVFDKKTFNILTSHRSYDHKIVLKKNAVFEYIFLYNMSEKKLKIVKKYLKDNLEKNFIIVNKLSFASSIMFMKKTNESLRFCVNYRKLNQLTKKNRYSLSLIAKTLAHLEKTQYFTKLNIKQAFHRIKIANLESENLTTFRTRFDAYKYRVLSFELCNESVTYQHYMNDVFFDYLDDFVSAYIDDILIYNNSKAEHIKHVKKILQRLRDADLQANINKCEFSIHETKYLRLIVERDEIKMNSFKVETILQ
jgi:hypothetical protein